MARLAILSVAATYPFSSLRPTCAFAPSISCPGIDFLYRSRHCGVIDDKAFVPTFFVKAFFFALFSALASSTCSTSSKRLRGSAFLSFMNGLGRDLSASNSFLIPLIFSLCAFFISAAFFAAYGSV